MKRAKEGAAAGQRPAVVVSKVQLEGDDDWYTPEAFKISPVRVVARVGKTGKGMACVIEEAEWERRRVEVFLLHEDRKHPHFHSDVHNTIGHGPGGSFTRGDIDDLIAVLTAARDEAEKRGLFTPRPTPTSIEEVFAARDTDR